MSTINMLKLGPLLIGILSIHTSFSQSFTQQIDSLKNLLGPEISLEEKVDINNDISYAFRRILPDSTLVYAELALSLAISSEYDQGMAEAYKNKGIAHFKLGSGKDSTIHYYTLALSYAEKVGDYYTQVASLNNIGLIEVQNLNYNLALENYLKALEIFEEHLRDPNRLLALIFGNIGFINFKLEQYEQALVYYEKCLEVADQLKLPIIYSIYLDEQVQTKVALKQYDEAISDIQRIMPLQEELEDWESKMETLLNYAEIEIKLKRFGSAFDHAQEAYTIAKSYGFANRSAFALLTMSRSLKGQEKWEQSLTHAREAMVISKKSESLSIQAQSLELFHQIYSRMGEMDSAYVYSLLFNQARERVVNSRYEEIAADLDAKMNIQAREREIKQLQMEKSRQRTFILLTSGFCLLFLSLMLIAIRLFWLKNTTAKMLNTKNSALQTANQELRMAEEALNQKNEELNTYIDSNMQLENFAYLASHDLREPITNVLGFTDYLIKNYKTAIDETGQKCLKFIQDSSKRMQYLTSDLLTYSIIGKDKNFDRVCVDQIIDEVQQDLATSIAENNAVICYPTLPELFGIHTEIRMLFQNIISNAIKYGKPGGRPVIDIGFQDKGEFIQFSISDNGIGIPPDFHEKIFLMFKRNDVENKYKGDSTGIGLAICKRVVEFHNGKIWLTSSVGKGTIFYFTLPKYRKQTVSLSQVI